MKPLTRISAFVPQLTQAASRRHTLNKYSNEIIHGFNMRDYCYELAKLLYRKINDGDTYFAEGVNSTNDLRRTIGELRLDEETAKSDEARTEMQL